MNGFQQVDHQAGIGAANPEIDDGDAIGRSGLHGSVGTVNGYVVLVGEGFDIAAKIDEQDIFSEFFERHASVAGQPIFYDGGFIGFFFLEIFEGNSVQIILCDRVVVGLLIFHKRFSAQRSVFWRRK